MNLLETAKALVKIAIVADRATIGNPEIHPEIAFAICNVAMDIEATEKRQDKCDHGMTWNGELEPYEDSFCPDCGKALR